jgi:hypothetical protein
MHGPPIYFAPVGGDIADTTWSTFRVRVARSHAVAPSFQGCRPLLRENLSARFRRSGTIHLDRRIKATIWNQRKAPG